MKVLFNVIFLTILIPSILSADVENKNIQQLEAELIEKKERLNLLNKQVIEHAEIINFIERRVVELSVALIKNKKNKFIQNNPDKEISDNDLADIFVDDMNQFMEAFFDVKNKNEQYVVTNTFFGKGDELFDTNAAIFKFYLIRSCLESGVLKELLIQWETLQNEVLGLQIQFNEARKI